MKIQGGQENSLDFPILNDGQFHRYTLRLADAAGYRGSMVRLRFDPAAGGGTGDWVKIRSIRLSKTAPAPQAGEEMLRLAMSLTAQPPTAGTSSRD